MTHFVYVPTFGNCGGRSAQSLTHSGNFFRQFFEERKGAAMKGCPTPRFLAVIVAAVCVALLAGSALAQYQTGNIYGKVQAKDGSVLPGVTVVLTGVGAPQTTITGNQGDFRFVNLSPGTYSLKAELAGFGSAARSGVSV